MMKKLMVSVVMASMLAACAPGQGPNKEQVGGVLGGALGGVLGSNVGSGQGRTAAIIGGTLLGAVMGSSIGSSLDKADLAYANQAQNSAYTARMGETISWKNPESGHSGTYTPVREGTSSSGSYCREYRTTVSVAGKVQKAYGTACRQPDGTWRIQQ